MKNSIYLALLLLITPTGFAGEIDKELNQTLLADYYQAIELYGDLTERCDEKKAPVLPKNLFSGIDMTKVEMDTIFNFFRSRAFVNCTQDGLNNYVLRATLLRVKAQTGESKEMIAASDELITYNYLSFLRDKVEYQKLNRNLRSKVEQIPELQQLFNVLKSYENLMESF
ncbi:hypothetical protein [Thalassotalea ganghwensis]